MSIEKTEDGRWYGRDSDGDLWGDCDCCGKNYPLHQVFSNSCGETWACEGCLGYEPEDDDEERYRYETGA